MEAYSASYDADLFQVGALGPRPWAQESLGPGLGPVGPGIVPWSVPWAGLSGPE